MLSVALFLKLRRERDSNPRTADVVNGFRDRPIRPLWHLSNASILKNKSDFCSRFISAEKEGFAPPVHCCTTVFKTAAIDHSAISPLQRYNFFVSCKLFLKKIFFLLQSPNKSSIFVIANEKFFYK